ncbi:MAG: 50S ribosomal protein L15 [Deltaproteobacteria bacterium]|nr:50S ribosomal protein L15 [Deltaproteobacteria bacterium]
MITLGQLKRRKDARFKVKRVGRGSGSGHGGHESSRGSKGQKSRTGGSIHPSFEGGQMPLQRRLPKQGFTQIPTEKVQIVNVDRLEKFSKDAVVDLESLKKKRLISSVGNPIKILGRGELKKSLTVKAHYFSKSAQDKIIKAGGKIEVLGVGH